MTDLKFKVFYDECLSGDAIEAETPLKLEAEIEKVNKISDGKGNVAEVKEIIKSGNLTGATVKSEEFEEPTKEEEFEGLNETPK